MRHHQRLFLLLSAISGLGVLAMETIWIRTLSLTIGSMVTSATLVVCSFFLFAALGNGVGAILSARFSRPMLGYALCEGSFALACTLFYLQRETIHQFILPLPQSIPLLLQRSLLTMATVAVPSFLSGMSFPFLSQVFIPASRQRTATGGKLYAANLLGAATGILTGGLLLPFYLGYTSTVLIVAAILLLGALLAILSERAITADIHPLLQIPHRQPHPPPAGNQQDSTLVPPAWGWTVAIASGFLSIGMQGLVFHYTQLLGTSTIYSTSIVLFTYIVALSIGAGASAQLRHSRIPISMSLSMVLWLAGLCWILFPYVMRFAVRYGWIHMGATSLADISLRVGLEAMAILLIPIAISGMLFPLAWDLVWPSAQSQGKPLGTLVMSNKIASAMGAILIPFGILPVFGLARTTAICAILYLTLAIVTDILRARIQSPSRPWLLIRTALLAMSLLLALQSTTPVFPEAGETILAVHEGAGGVAAVVEDAAGSRHIILNQRYTLNGTGRAMQAQKHESWIPLFLHGRAQRVIFIGMASGISASAALDFPIQQLTAVELVPEVAAAAQTHFEPWNQALFNDPRARVLVDDGRAAISRLPPADVIIVDLFMPCQEGTANLYSLDFLCQAKDRLTPGGLFCLWLPSYQHDAELSGIVIRTFLEAFPCAILVRGNLDPLQPIIALVGSTTPLAWSDADLSARLAALQNTPPAGESPFLRTPANARMLLIGDLQAARSDWVQQTLTTDEHPWFAFRGAKPLLPGTILRGSTFLNQYGKRFLTPGYPSLALGTTSPAIVLSHIRAGNYAFAAAIAAVPHPQTSPDLSMERASQVMQHLQRVSELAPGASLWDTDLGK